MVLYFSSPKVEHQFQVKCVPRAVQALPLQMASHALHVRPVILQRQEVSVENVKPDNLVIQAKFVKIVKQVNLHYLARHAKNVQTASTQFRAAHANVKIPIISM